MLVVECRGMFAKKKYQSVLESVAVFELVFGRDFKRKNADYQKITPCECESASKVIKACAHITKKKRFVFERVRSSNYLTI